ncbi:MAG: hypothetical protein JWQ74_1071 [Marmoricola sp.]|nr:hypothetical protein [Marmoricola sp.]
MPARGGYGTSAHAAAVPNVTFNPRVFVGDREITDIARVEVDAALAGAATGVTYGQT